MEKKQTTLPATIDMNAFTDIMQQAPDTLAMNRTSARRCVEAGEQLLQNAAQAGMNGNLDNLMASFVAKAKRTLDATNEQRKPFTAILDEVKKQFTACENTIKDITARVQAERNAYATKLAEERAAAERAAAEKLRIEQRRIELKKTIHQNVLLFIEDLLNNVDKDFSAKLATVPLSAMGTMHDKVDRMAFPTLADVVKEFVPVCSEIKEFPESERADIINEIAGIVVTDEAMEKYSDICARKVAEYHDKIDIRRRELMQMAEADESKRAEMQRMSDERDRREAERKEAERKEAEEKAKAAAEAEALKKSLENRVDTQATLFNQPERKDKESVEIIAHHPAAYLLMVQQWFDEEGKNLDMDKVAGMTFKRIKTWCEKYTSKEGVSIQSPYIEYKSVVTAK
ncbi:MAG: hypothetical protein NC048_09850 [Bacteroides sp.]|nr:hypothetical protein [Bacteroides sp.]MCM1555776.1 hypothetical protein [Bacteroides sp.]